MPKVTPLRVFLLVLGTLVIPCLTMGVPAADAKDTSKDEELLRKAGIRLVVLHRRRHASGPAAGLQRRRNAGAIHVELFQPFLSHSRVPQPRRRSGHRAGPGT